jgi:hypothetical protein
MTNNSKFFEFDFGKDGGKRSFSTIDDVSEFVASERKAWAWLDTLTSDSSVARDAKNKSDQLFNDIGNYITQIRQNPQYSTENITAAFQRAFVNRIPLTGSKRYKFINSWIEKNDPVLAASIAATFLGSASGNVSAEGLRGAVHAVCFDLGINPHSAQAVEQELSSWVERHGEAHGAAIQAHSGLIAKTSEVEAALAKAESEREQKARKLLGMAIRSARKHRAQRAALRSPRLFLISKPSKNPIERQCGSRLQWNTGRIKEMSTRQRLGGVHAICFGSQALLAWLSAVFLLVPPLLRKSSSMPPPRCRFSAFGQRWVCSSPALCSGPGGF